MEQNARPVSMLHSIVITFQRNITRGDGIDTEMLVPWLVLSLHMTRALRARVALLQPTTDSTKS
jgi:hypothetical protein